jgi:hypothetical protein
MVKEWVMILFWGGDRPLIELLCSCVGSNSIVLFVQNRFNSKKCFYQLLLGSLNYFVGWNYLRMRSVNYIVVCTLIYLCCTGYTPFRLQTLRLRNVSYRWSFKNLLQPISNCWIDGCIKVPSHWIPRRNAPNTFCIGTVLTQHPIGISARFRAGNCLNCHSIIHKNLTLLIDEY